MIVVVVLVILNIVLLGYIMMGLSGGNVGLSPFPTSWGDKCNDGNMGIPCKMGDPTKSTQFLLRTSQIRDYYGDQNGDGLKILSGVSLGDGSNKKIIKLAGIENGNEVPSAVTVNGFLSATGGIQGDSLAATQALNVGADRLIVSSSGIYSSLLKNPVTNGSYNYLFVSANGILVAKSSPCK